MNCRAQRSRSNLKNFEIEYLENGTRSRLDDTLSSKQNKKTKTKRNKTEFRKQNSTSRLIFESDLQGSSEVKNIFTIRKPIYDFLFDFYGQHLYLVPFSRYSTSKFSSFDLDLWPSEVTRVQKYFHHSTAHTWLPINFYWHFLSISYRFRDFRLQSFQGLTLTFDL